ncbi:thioesterase family protein [Meiothermus sp. CFH 77666]|uniref:YbgC/FadM family acyl-CoA thioesterase n=1 Tax=Meiothermus sp. CFH 77666 TaxID=2817942 RepID=UPI001AA0A9B0|nr:acyl-CoA thioesterase [Meiothermus sp. CFH 77666]
MNRCDFSFFHRLRVRWAEADPQGIVFNGHYLTYFDVGITEYWRALGIPYPSTVERYGVDLFVVKATVEYHAPARYDDELDIGVRVGRIGNSSMQFVLGIFRGEAHLISGEVIYVAADAQTRKPQTVPPALRELLGH